MKQATDKSKNSKAIVLNAKHRIGEGMLILMFAVAAYLVIALVSYHSSDPGWSTSGAGGFVTNAGGRAGAFFADIFLYFFGYTAYLFPFMLAVSAWLIFRARLLNRTSNFYYVLLHLVGFVVTLLSGCALFRLYLPTWHAHLPLAADGLLGGVIGSSFVNILNLLGARLILIAFLLIGVTLFTGLSWLLMLNLSGKGCVVGLKCFVRGLKWIGSCFLTWRDKRRDRKASVMAKKPIPVIKSSERQPIGKQPKMLAIDFSPRQITKKNKPRAIVSKLTGKVPSFDLLNLPEVSVKPVNSQTKLEALSRELEQRLLDFGIEVSVEAIHPGPVITRFELSLAPGVKVSKISILAKDLARALSVSRVRVVEVIPGKSVIGIEIPNDDRVIVCLREVFESQHYENASSPLSLALGKDIGGYPVVVDLGKMPHLLVAGTTGSGKSVSLNSMLMSILFKATPEEVRMILVDPKMLELSIYDGIPHLLTPVVTDVKDAANAFRWCVAEMERRYRLMASQGVRKLASYNDKVGDAIKKGQPILDPLIPNNAESEEPKTLEPLPYIVVVVDELSDMMMVVGKKVEELIARIAQKARAAGIHMILATQRPSVDVITGLIKANIPTRIAFQVSSRIDSRTILDQQGAEQLLGHGDMLYLPPGTGLPVRVHGAFISDDEIHRVVADWKLRGEPEYMEEILQNGVESDGFSNDGTMIAEEGESDPLYDQAVNIVIESRRASISYVQRRLKIGYNRAARMLEEMENAGVVSEMGNNGAREVLVPSRSEDE